MTNQTSLFLAAMIVIALLADLVLTGGAGIFFLTLKFMDLLDWMIFWR